MSFKINKSDLDITNEIQCNYYRCNIYLNQYKKKQKNGGFIEIPMHMSKNEPTLASTFFQEMYIANNIYITPPLHKIESVDYDGELIIEHSSISNEYEKAYFCILLKTKKTNSIENNVIDKIINPEKENQTQTFELNSIIFPNSSCLYYNSNTIFKSQKIVIFTTPVYVNSDFGDFTDSPNLFNLSSNNYSLIPLTTSPKLNHVEGFTPTAPAATSSAGATSKSAAVPVTRTIHCQPISEIDNADDSSSNQLEPSYLVPVQGQFSNLKSTNQFLQITIYYCTFIVITLGILIILPNTYNGLGIVAIKSYFQNKTDGLGNPLSDERVNENTIIGLNTLDFCARAFFILFTIGCFIFGFLYQGPDSKADTRIENLKTNVIMFGLYFFIILITCSVVIFNAKEGLLTQNNIIKRSNIADDFSNVINNIMNQLMNMTSKEEWISGYSAALLIFGIVIYLIFDYKTFFGYFDKTMVVLTISIIFGIYITLYYLIFVLLGKT
jgi:hypothetical protein